MAKKSRAMSIASFAFGLVFWIPLLNVIFGLIAIHLGIKSIRNIKKNPEVYGGKAFAVAGIVLGILPIFFSLFGLGLCLFGQQDICVNMGLWFLV